MSFPPQFEPLEPRKLLSTYYVSPEGSDRNPGTIDRPWQTLERVNRQAFRGGDRILLEGGQMFSGMLYLGPDDRGSRAAPIAISSYGPGGRARINGGMHGHGLFAYNTAGLEITGLNFSGPAARGRGRGILLYNDLSGDQLLDYVRIDDVSALRHEVGIEIGGGRGRSGYQGVHITNTEVYHNRDTGLVMYAADRNVHTKVLIQNVRAFSNSGTWTETGGSDRSSGSGILLGGVNYATVEHSEAFNNGYLGDGGAGIWTYNSNKVIFQFNESYANRTAGGVDGDGFDFDQNVSNSVMQYNYAHDNDGAGFLLASFQLNNLHTNTFVRYNVSQNDSRKVGMGAIHAFGRITNSYWYNNTVRISPNGVSSPYAMQIFNATVENHHADNIVVRNNAIQTSGGVPAVSVTSEQLDGATGIRFEGNNYFAADDELRFAWGERWRGATGQERVNGEDVGSAVDPRHRRPNGGPAIAYRLWSDSPLIGHALNLPALFGLETGGRDFLGNPVSPESAEVGAFEYVG
jgi:hypothetical protein